MTILHTPKNQAAIVESYCGSARPPRPLRRTPLRVLRQHVHQLRGHLADRGAENLQFSVAGRSRLECVLAESFMAQPDSGRGQIMTRSNRLVLRFGSR